jgi:Leucine-rich repeat (LRR) protein
MHFLPAYFENEKPFSTQTETPNPMSISPESISPEILRKIGELNILCDFILKNEKNIKTISIVNEAKTNKAIEPLQKISSLNLSCCKLQKIPEEIHLLLNLSCLDLNNNKLSSLPEALVKLRQLTTLKLDENRFSTMPSMFYKMNLKTLYCYGNPLDKIPLCFKRILVAAPYGATWTE